MEQARREKKGGGRRKGGEQKRKREKKMEKQKRKGGGRKEVSTRDLKWDLLPYRPSHYHGATPSLSGPGPAPYYLSQILFVS